ncbi:MAG: phosphoesterase, partial [Clostridia bacterium]
MPASKLPLLFEFLEQALEFDKDFAQFRAKIKNKIEIFGNQFFVDQNDNIVGTDEFLLPVATSLSLDDAYALAIKYNAFVYPAHIDRHS